MATSSTYNISPTPQQGQGAFGAVPGVIQTPPSVFEELNQNVPNYGALTKTATGTVGSELGGQVSPSTINMLQNAAASRGITSGTGTGSGFAQNNFLQNLGLTAEGLQHTGLTDYNALTGQLGATQTQPSLVADIATQNAIDAAAPNPQQAQSYAQMLFNQYLNGGNGASRKNTGNSYGFIPVGGNPSDAIDFQGL